MKKGSKTDLVEDTKKTKEAKKDIKKTKKASKELKKEKVVKPKKEKFSLGKFFKEVKVEMTKVRWPNKKEMFTNSTATIVFIVIFACFFALTDLAIAGIKLIFR